VTTNPEDFAANARRAESVLTSALDTWKNGLDSVTNQFRAFPSVGNLPQFDATEAVERQFAFIQQIVELNHQYARQLAEVANTLTGATRQQIQSVSGAVRDQVQNVAETARGNVDQFEQTVRDTADQAEQAQREAREQAEEAQRQQERDAAKAERQDRKQTRDQARERYQSLTKSELADEAGKRNLPKTGTVDELVDRLVADDTK
jgi:phage-related protein